MKLKSLLTDSDVSRDSALEKRKRKIEEYKKNYSCQKLRVGSTKKYFLPRKQDTSGEETDNSMLKYLRTLTVVKSKVDVT